MDTVEFDKPKAIEGLTEGRIVHYVLPTEFTGGHLWDWHRPAVVVRVLNHKLGYVNLQVFNDGTPNLVWVADVIMSEGKQPGTWHFIEGLEQ